MSPGEREPMLLGPYIAYFSAITVTSKKSSLKNLLRCGNLTIDGDFLLESELSAAKMSILTF